MVVEAAPLGRHRRKDLDEPPAVAIERDADTERHTEERVADGTSLKPNRGDQHDSERDDEDGEVDVAVPPEEVGREVEAERRDQGMQQRVSPCKPGRHGTEAPGHAAVTHVCSTSPLATSRSVPAASTTRRRPSGASPAAVPLTSPTVTGRPRSASRRSSAGRSGASP